MTVSEEPDFSDPEDYEDDISDSELLGDLLLERPKVVEGVDSVIVVDGIPRVTEDRLEKLKNIIKKLYSKFGSVINEYYPLDDEKKTKGYTFLEFSSSSSAVEAVKQTNNYKLDKMHTFSVNLFSDFEKYENIPSVWEPPLPEPYTDIGNIKSWLLEPDACDQYSVVYEGGDKVSVNVNTIPEVSEVHSRNRWTETYVKWSPLGSYLATFHSRGIALWGGSAFQQISKFNHGGVQFIDFSPGETYMVTFSPLTSDAILWETRSGSKKRQFTTDSHFWPLFKWSHNDKYFARLFEGSLSVYETPSCGLLDKKSFKVPGMKDFSWSPTDCVLAYWVAENKDVPARVTLIEVPSRNETRVKNLFNVADCKIHWQKNGDYLCVKVDRYCKLRKEKEDHKYAGLYYNFEIFHMREKQIPVDSVEIKENVIAFAWEPTGNKFAIIHGDGGSQLLNVSFYSVNDRPILLKKYERKSANHLFWSPRGQFIVLAGLRNLNGILEFIDTADFTVMNTGDHFMCTDIEWDPTGRYLTTGVSWWGHKVDNAYWMWSFQGKILKRYPTDRFCQLLWRPRPPSLLSPSKLKEIKKNLKKYSVHFEAKDKIRLSKASKELLDKRNVKYTEFKNYRGSKDEAFASYQSKRRELRNNIYTDTLETENAVMEEEVIEFLVKEEEFLID